ncbi:MAG: hypothetical protein R6V04_15285, partial [bacterium]
TRSKDVEPHLLGYYVDYTSDALVDSLARFQSLRLERAKEIVCRMHDRGIDLSWERVLDLAGGRKWL